VVKLRPSATTTASSPGSSLPPSPSPGSQGNATPGYNGYANPRYGFTTLWPSSFRAQPPPEDGDGQAWTSPDGQVQLSAYGANNVLNYSPEQDEAADASALSVVYSNISGDIVTVSGYENNGRTIVYQRDVVGSGSIDTLYWSYPANQKAQWNATVTLTALTFQPGNMCSMCKMVKAAKQQQEQSPATAGKVAGKILLVFEPVPQVVVACPSFLSWSLSDRILAGFQRAAPPVPPPRGLVA